eukprot:5840173-Pyramimonas_sp.AAC.1
MPLSPYALRQPASRRGRCRVGARITGCWNPGALRMINVRPSGHRRCYAARPWLGRAARGALRALRPPVCRVGRCGAGLTHMHVLIPHA